MQSTTILETP